MPTRETQGKQRPTTCTGCRHYWVTWDRERPHGCRAFEFKSAAAPWRVVQESGGGPCRMREAQPRR